MVRRAWDDVWQAFPRTRDRPLRRIRRPCRPPPIGEHPLGLSPNVVCNRICGMVRFLVGAQWRAPVHGCASIAWRAEHPSPPVVELPSSFAAGVRYPCSCVVCRLTEQALPLLSVCWCSTAGERQCVLAAPAPRPCYLSTLVGRAYGVAGESAHTCVWILYVHAPEVSMIMFFSFCDVSASRRRTAHRPQDSGATRHTTPRLASAWLGRAGSRLG